MLHFFLCAYVCKKLSFSPCMLRPVFFLSIVTVSLCILYILHSTILYMCLQICMFFCNVEGKEDNDAVA